MAQPVIHVHVHEKGKNKTDSSQILALLGRILANQEKLMADLSGITDAVTGLTSVVDSAVALLGALADEIRTTAPTQAALDDLAASVEAAKAELADAITANTDAAPPTPTQV